ncbi:MAG: serine/threonine-protein kinase [Polyangiales bacterium]
MQSIQQLAPGTTFAKDFRVERTLGVGGMGAVYEATLTETGQRVALKLMHPSQIADAKLRQRFAQEARVGAWIGSPHIVDVVRAGVDESGVPWLAMELLQGHTLASKLQRYLPAQGLPHDEAWLVLAQLCRGLIAAHEKGVVHRDLKPENVFVTSSPRADAPFTVKILDFGIAKRIDPATPESNRTTAIGTPLWMAPEQNEVTEITPAADVWAVGLVCFRMFTGRFYWLAANEPELNLGWLFHELVTEALVPASVRAEMLGCELLLPMKFDAVFSRCVARDPRQRFANARELAEALAAIAPPYFKPFDTSPTLPPGAAPPYAPSRPSPPPAASPPTLVAAAPAAPPRMPTNVGAAPHLPSPALAAGPTAPPPRDAPSRVPLFVGAVMIVVLVAAAIAFFTAGAKPADAPPPTPDVPLALPAAPQPAAQVPALGSLPLPSSPGPVPVDPSAQRRIK